MRRPAAIVALACVVLFAGIALATGSDSAKTTGPPTLASNESAAKADAATLLGEVTLPAGAQESGVEPAGDNGYLHPLPHLSANPGYVDTAWWRVKATTPAAVIAVVGAAPPPGLASTGTGGGANTQTGTSSTGLTFAFDDVPGVLESRIVEVTATALPGGDTGVMVQSQSQWVVPRPAQSFISRNTRLIHVAETTAKGRVLRSVTVTAAVRVRATVSYINGLELGQPGTTSCGAESGESDVLTLQFLSRTGAAPLATVSFSGDFGQRYSGVSTECNEVQLRVGTQAPVGLLGGSYTSSINRLLGTHIP